MPGKQFPEADAILETLKRECYFKDEAGNHQWPEVFDQLLEDKCMFYISNLA